MTVSYFLQNYFAAPLTGQPPPSYSGAAPVVVQVCSIICARKHATLHFFFVVK